MDNVIDGAGQIGAVGSGAAGLTLVNQSAGLIEASGNNALTINTGLGGVTNSGRSSRRGDEEVNTGEILLEHRGAAPVNNGNAGQLLVNDGSTVNFAEQHYRGWHT